MKTFEQLTIKQVKKEILYWEQDNENPKSVIVICVGQSPDSDIYEQGDGTTCEHFFALVVINGVKQWKGYEWCCDEEDITSSWDGPTCDEAGYEGFYANDDEEDDDGELPENVVERCKYVSQTMDSTDLSHCNVDVNAELKVPVTMVRWNYPFEVKEGSYNVYPIEEAHTWGELLIRIVEVFQREYAADERTHFHALGDYIIEPLEIHPNGLATVYFGS